VNRNTTFWKMELFCKIVEVSIRDCDWSQLLRDIEIEGNREEDFSNRDDDVRRQLRSPQAGNSRCDLGCILD